MQKVPKFAVFASGRGSNFEAICSAVDDETIFGELVCLVCDQPEAPVIEKAKQKDIPVVLVPKEKSKKEHEAKIIETLDAFKPDFIVLAGYMRVFTEDFIDHYRSSLGYSKIINIHPSILPSFPGVNSYQQAFDYGCHLAGVTIHLVEKEVDSGPICQQQSFSISECHSVKEVEELGLQIEHELYPKVIDWVINENFELAMNSKDRRRFRVRPC